MSENVDVVKRAVDAINRADFDGVVTIWTIRGGRVAAVKLYQSKAEALEAG